MTLNFDNTTRGKLSPKNGYNSEDLYRYNNTRRQSKDYSLRRYNTEPIISFKGNHKAIRHRSQSQTELFSKIEAYKLKPKIAFVEKEPCINPSQVKESCESGEDSRESGDSVFEISSIVRGSFSVSSIYDEMPSRRINFTRVRHGLPANESRFVSKNRNLKTLPNTPLITENKKCEDIFEVNLPKETDKVKDKKAKDNLKINKLAKDLTFVKQGTFIKEAKKPVEFAEKGIQCETFFIPKATILMSKSKRLRTKGDQKEEKKMPYVKECVNIRREIKSETLILEESDKPVDSKTINPPVNSKIVEAPVQPEKVEILKSLKKTASSTTATRSNQQITKPPMPRRAKKLPDIREKIEKSPSNNNNNSNSGKENSLKLNLEGIRDSFADLKLDCLNSGGMTYRVGSPIHEKVKIRRKYLREKIVQNVKIRIPPIDNQTKTLLGIQQMDSKTVPAHAQKQKGKTTAPPSSEERRRIIKPLMNRRQYRALNFASECVVGSSE